MMSSVQAPAQTAAETPLTYRGTMCPECMALFLRKHPNQLFCSVEHRDAWNNRQAVRGRVLTPLAIVARVTREGSRGDKTIGKRAAADRNMLIQRWIDEDRAAGRMPWAEYMSRRYRVGFDPLS